MSFELLSPIFPGMDPYLEDPQIWPSVHARFIVYLSDALQPLLRPRYFATVEERVFVEGPNRSVAPDVWLLKSRQPRSGPAAAVVGADDPEVEVVEPLELRETYIEIRHHATGQELVTLIELLSPANKYSGPGHDSYVTKQAEVLGSRTHLVEIDLLREGPHVLAVPEWKARRKPYDYLVCVNRSGDTRNRYELYRLGLRNRLRRVKIPLAHGDAEVGVDLQAVLATTYEKGVYRERLRYDLPCVPALTQEDQQWAQECIDRAVRSDEEI
jgi:hypothetical protein